MINRSRLLALFALVATSLSLHARVISYAPYSDRAAFIAHQSRTNRHFLTVEAAPSSSQGPYYAPTYGQLVMYDSTGAEEPKVIFPTDNTNAVFTSVGVRETGDGTPAIFAQISTQQNTFVSYFSSDGGNTWKTLDLPSAAIAQLGTTGPDNGGPFASYRYSQVRIGSADYPFVVATPTAVVSISRIGMTRRLYEVPSAAPATQLAGRNGAGTEFLVRTQSQLIAVDLNGATRTILSSFLAPNPLLEGFIANDGSVYVEERSTSGSGIAGKIWLVQNGQTTRLFDVTWPYDLTTASAFIVPSSDDSNAWAIERGGGKPTSLYKIMSGTTVKMWEDITSPEVEALHAGASGNKLLVQVHRPRPGVDTMFHDPALAVWHVGDAAPRAYDELFLDEQPNKGFVHVDVEAIESGTPFVFDSGTMSFMGGGGGGVIFSPPTSGGSDVTQEWGVVRASLKQQLMLPAVGKTKGAFGSDWVSDVVIQNPLDTEQHVTLRFVPNGTGANSSALNQTTIMLAAGEIRMIKDVVGTLFGVESGIGAMFIDPEAGVTVTSRTYSRSGGGTFGFGMNAIDVMAAAASPRFPVTFSGAFPSRDFRTNITLTDTSGHGSEAVLSAAGVNGAMGSDGVTISVGPNKHTQVNFIGTSLGVEPSATGALTLRPTRGTAVAAVFAIDNRTNDSTYYPPDLPAPPTGSRVIPAIGHLDGANGSHFRSDLYLYNPTDTPRSVWFMLNMWDRSAYQGNLSLTLLPHEARVIRDVLMTAFGKTGIASLRVVAQGGSSGGGIRFTSRTYSAASDGGTYGFLMPPFSSFQLGANGDTLEILGAFADPDYRTNIGLVESAETGNNANASARVEILDASSHLVDSFTVEFPMNGGTQLNDVFRARGLTISGPVLIRVTPQNGVIGAYATTTDNATNDSSYLAANLAAKK
jgi:hypothetical protein